MKTTKTLSWWDKTNNDTSMMAKWIALYEAVNMVADKAEEKGIPVDEIIYKPKPIRDYIESTQDIIHKKILQQEYNIEICYSEEEENFDDDIKIY